MNPVLATIPSSLIRALNALKQPGDIDLGLGEPLLAPAMAPFEAALAWVADHGCPYTANAGDPALRQAIASHYAYPGLADAANVCITVGSQEALYLAIKALCDPAADEVLLVGPGYPAYGKMCHMEGIAVRGVGLAPEADFRPDAARVLAALRPATRLVLLASPSNPTGRVWPAAEWAALAAGLKSRPGPPVYVLVDEVYRELVYGDTPYVSFASMYDFVLVANSLSKSHALTGLRLGWLLGPEAVMAAAIKVHQFINTAASTFSQQVASAIFADPATMDAHRAHYERQRASLLSNLAATGLDHVVPEGGFYCMVRLPAALAGDSVAVAHQLLESRRVVTVPGAAFDAEGWLRLSWVAAPETLAQGLQRISSFFDLASEGRAF